MAKISTYVIQIPKPEDILLGTETARTSLVNTFGWSITDGGSL